MTERQPKTSAYQTDEKSASGAPFPIFLKLAGRRCLVIGAGHVAEQKIQALLAAGAEVQVVAPKASDAVREMAASGRIDWSPRPFQPEDLDGALLVVGATGDREVNTEIFRRANAGHVLCNAVDEPEHCDFYYPAVVRRGDLQIAISTAGQSPALAQRLRRELEAVIGPEYQDLLQWLGKVRKMLFRRTIDPQVRRRTLHRIASREVAERFLGTRRRISKE
jgi:precorrin-2 dehydrogenase/sirohydrochlorin ferrochelatase